MIWAPETKELLRELWDAGLSASKIAERFPGKTRNAVLGQAHRMYLLSRPSPIKRALTKEEPPQQYKAAVTEPHQARVKSAAITAALKTQPFVLEETKKHTTQGKLLHEFWDRTPYRDSCPFKTCQWIEGDGPPFAKPCGKPTAHRVVPYCQEHAERAYILRPAREMKDVGAEQKPNAVAAPE